MARYRSSRRRAQWPRYLVSVVAVGIVGGGGWWYFSRTSETDGGPRNVAPPLTAESELASEAGAGSDGSEPASVTAPPDEVLTPQRGTRPPVAEAALAANPIDAEADADLEGVEDERAGASANDLPRPGPLSVATGNAAIGSARRTYQQGRPIEARHALNSLLNKRLTNAEQNEVRALLTRIANETVFSKDRPENDPIVEMYKIESGDSLDRIGRTFSVPYEVIMTINQMRGPNIRAGKSIKVPRGPFHAKIYKSAFRMDLYLQDVYVRSYRVGLGKHSGTPTGLWKVKDRLPNPRYYPPASAERKVIIEPNDPTNPLGEHWIGLKGIEGDCVGEVGFGIHGTIEPESIGKAASAGCVRMHNEDVAFVYQLLRPGKSTVTILP